MRIGQKHHDEWIGSASAYSIAPSDQYKRCTLQPVVNQDVRPKLFEPKSTLFLSHDPATFEHPEPRSPDTKIHYEPSTKSPTRSPLFLPRNNIYSPFKDDVSREERLRELQMRTSKVDDTRRSMTCAEFVSEIRTIPDDVDKVKRAQEVRLVDFGQHGRDVLAEFKSKRAKEMLSSQYEQ